MHKRIFRWTILVALLVSLAIFAFGLQAAKAQLEGDVDDDGDVDMEDLIMTAGAFGTSAGHPRWNPDADLNDDDMVNIIDLGIVARNFGSTL